MSTGAVPRVRIGGIEAGLDRPFFLIAGPCVVESEQLQMDTAGALREMCAELGVPLIFKSSYDKANRSSGQSFRGPGITRGLEILAKVKRELGVPILTDVHTDAEVAVVAPVVDMLQTPAFLCRQTDFIAAVARSGKPVNIKKGQFLAPQDMLHVIDKARAAARASTGTMLRCPPLLVPCAPGSCTLWVASNTTGAWVVRMMAKLRISDTRLL